jgi:hypothetical protein
VSTKLVISPNPVSTKLVISPNPVSTKLVISPNCFKIFINITLINQTPVYFKYKHWSQGGSVQIGFILTSLHLINSLIPIKQMLLSI